MREQYTDFRGWSLKPAHRGPGKGHSYCIQGWDQQASLLISFLPTQGCAEPRAELLEALLPSLDRRAIYLHSSRRQLLSPPLSQTVFDLLPPPTAMAQDLQPTLTLPAALLRNKRLCASRLGWPLGVHKRGRAKGDP